MGGAELLFLICYFNFFLFKAFFDQFSFMPHDNDYIVGFQRLYGIYDPVYQRAPRKFMNNFGPGRFHPGSGAGGKNSAEAAGRLGVTARALSGEERRQLELRGGLLVENAQGAAARAGIRRGDVILSVNGEAVSTPDQLRSIIAKAGKRVALLVQRESARLFVPVDLN